MKKVLGWILLMPLIILGVIIVFFPMIIGFYKNDWLPAITLYGTSIIMGLGTVGANLLDN
jgi:hypothetical protein